MVEFSGYQRVSLSRHHLHDTHETTQKMTQLDQKEVGGVTPSSPSEMEMLATEAPVITKADLEDYGADKIKVLEGLEAVRKRPAMYIGSTGASGLHHLVYEVVDNAIDEALVGFCDLIKVTIHIDNSITVVDNGRCIPVGLHSSGRPAAEVVLTVLHAGGKFDNESYKVSGGLHGVGVSVVNALSETLEIEIWRTGQVYQQSYSRGVPDGDLQVTGTTRRRGTKLTFKPDPDVFETVDYSFDTLAHRLRELAFLNAGVRVTLDDERDGKNHDFCYEGGINSFVQFLNKNRTAVNAEPIYMRGQRDGVDAEISLQWNDGYSEMFYAFANNINTQEGGTHVSGLRAALTRTLNVYASRQNLAKDLKESISGDDVREGLIPPGCRRAREESLIPGSPFPKGGSHEFESAHCGGGRLSRALRGCELWRDEDGADRLRQGQDDRLRAQPEGGRADH